ESEVQYHRQSVQILEDLRKQFGLSKSSLNSTAAATASSTARTTQAL
ncbi:unnamed protein product, partial [Rotaria magnacalcarata]